MSVLTMKGGDVKLHFRVLTKVDNSTSHSSCNLTSFHGSHQNVFKKLSKLNQKLCRVATVLFTVICHFRVPVASVSKRVLVHNLSYENEFYSDVHCCNSNSFSFEWLCSWTRFETEAKGNSKLNSSVALFNKIN